jgi:hypothetical protein
LAHNAHLSKKTILKFYNKFNWEILDAQNKIDKNIFKKMNREQKLYMIINYRKFWNKYEASN